MIMGVPDMEPKWSRKGKGKNVYTTNTKEKIGAKATRSSEELKFKFYDPS